MLLLGNDGSVTDSLFGKRQAQGVGNVPLGALMPIFLNRSASFIGQTIASTSSSICLSKPPTSVYFSVGFSSTSMALTLLSYSAGSVSRTRYESLLTPMRSPGLRAV